MLKPAQSAAAASPGLVSVAGANNIWRNKDGYWFRGFGEFENWFQGLQKLILYFSTLIVMWRRNLLTTFSSADSNMTCSNSCIRIIIITIIFTISVANIILKSSKYDMPPVKNSYFIHLFPNHLSLNIANSVQLTSWSPPEKISSRRVWLPILQLDIVNDKGLKKRKSIDLKENYLTRS